MAAGLVGNFDGTEVALTWWDKAGLRTTYGQGYCAGDAQSQEAVRLTVCPDLVLVTSLAAAAALGWSPAM